MQVTSMQFKARAGQKLADQRLQQNLRKLSTKWVAGRAVAITELDDFEASRDDAIARRCKRKLLVNSPVRRGGSSRRRWEPLCC